MSPGYFSALGRRWPSARAASGRATGALSETLRQSSGGGIVTPFAATVADDLAAALRDSSVVVTAGAAGVTLLPATVWKTLPNLKALIDLNAVPPLGIEAIEATDKNTERGPVRAWGALGVGGIKMKIHKKAIEELFTANDKIFDAEQVLELGRSFPQMSSRTRGAASSARPSMPRISSGSPSSLAKLWRWIASSIVSDNPSCISCGRARESRSGAAQTLLADSLIDAGVGGHEDPPIVLFGGCVDPPDSFARPQRVRDLLAVSFGLAPGRSACWVGGIPSPVATSCRVKSLQG